MVSILADSGVKRAILSVTLLGQETRLRAASRPCLSHMGLGGKARMGTLFTLFLCSIPWNTLLCVRVHPTQSFWAHLIVRLKEFPEVIRNWAEK